MTNQSCGESILMNKYLYLVYPEHIQICSVHNLRVN